MLFGNNDSDNVRYHYDIVRKNWIEKLGKNDYTS